MLLNARSPYSSHAAVPRSTQIALLIPMQRLGCDFIQPESHFPPPDYPAVPTDQRIQEAKSEWLIAVEGELEELDGLAEADGLVPISASLKAEAKRILEALNPQSIAPVIYPEDGEIVIYFKSPKVQASVGIEVSNDGRGACYSHIDGRNRSAHYGTSRDIPDEFVLARLRNLSSSK